MPERLYKYGVIFWSGRDEDDEVNTYFLAPYFMEAERYAAQFEKTGHIKGGVHYIEDVNMEYYTTKIEDYAEMKGQPK